MKEVKNPKKPWIYYYMIVLIVILCLNLILEPFISGHAAKEVSYDTFMNMMAGRDIGQVSVEDNQIIFIDKAEQNIYKTGKIDDPDLVKNLYNSGAEFSSEIVKETSPIMNLLLGWVVPILIFFALGQFMSKKMASKMGGMNAMQFGMGKSNAKIYVKSTAGITFNDVAGEDEAKEILS